MYDGYLQATVPLLHLVAVGVWHDQDNAHEGLWRDVLQRLPDARRSPDGTFMSALDNAQHYSALLALQVMGMTAIRPGRDALVLKLLAQVEWRSPFQSRDQSLHAAQALHYHRVLDADQIKALPRWGTTRWIYPISHMLKVDLRGVLRELIPNESEYEATFHNHEYRIGLVQHQDRDEPDAYRAASGEFVGERQWTRNGVPLAEIL